MRSMIATGGFLMLVLINLAAQPVDWRPGDSPKALTGWQIRLSAAMTETEALSDVNLFFGIVSPGQPVGASNLNTLPAMPLAGSGRVTAVSSIPGFIPYNGKTLPDDPAISRRLYTFIAGFTLGSADQAADAGTALALYLGPGEYPRDIFVNGVRLLKTGRHDDRYVATIFYSSRIPLPPQLLRYDGSPNIVTVLAWPDYETAPLGDIILGDYYDISGQVFLRDLFNLHFVRAAMVLAGFIGLYFLLLYIRSPDRDRRNLLFALTCFGFVLGHVNLSFFNDAANDVLLLKLSRTGLVLTGLFFALFAVRFSAVLSKKRWLPPLLSLPVLVSILINMLQSDKRGVSWFFSTFSTNFVLTPILVFTVTILVIGLARKRDLGSAAVLFGYGLSVAASLVDMAALASDTIPFCYLLAYGYLGLLVSIFIVLALEQSATSRQLHLQSGQLNARNRVLGEVVHDLSAVAVGLVASSAGLDAAIDETLGSVETFGEETRQASMAFKSQMQGVEDEINQIAARLAVSAERVPQALDSQTRAVEQMNHTLADMQERMDENLGSAAVSSRLAGELAADADQGSIVIGQSRGAMSHVAELSGTLQSVLASIENIAERTHVLSINAAIESARMGKQGRGFAVIAQEIRTLSEQSRASLGTSFARIAEMAGSVRTSSVLSDQAATTLQTIADRARTSAERTEDIRRLIELQRSQGQDILADANALLTEARILKDLSVDEKRSNEERAIRFKAMKDSLSAVSRKLEEQDARKQRLSVTLDAMRVVMADNAGHIERLKRTIESAKAV
jgi:methyl-accepting chemotaxis protein